MVTKRVLLLLALSFFLAGCGGVPSAAPQSQHTAAPTNEAAAGILDAVNAALQVEARYSRLPGADGLPTAPEVESALLLAASQAFPDAAELDDPRAPTWVVTIVGHWSDLAPQQGSAVLRTFRIYIDANTGEVEAWTTSD